MDLTLVPQFSAYDPSASGEGSIDPLGMEASAERLAEQLLPGMTARMWRVRMLTFMAVSAHVTDPFADEFTADQTTPSYLVFEWMYAEALARDNTEAQRLPGVQTAESNLHGGGRLASRLYLKSPRALGMHGFYRRLAEATRIVDSSGRILENGELLIEAWEKDRDLDGFLAVTGNGKKALEGLRYDLQKGLRTSKCALRPGSYGGGALRRDLTPAFQGRGRYERRFLRQLLDGDERRAETFELVSQIAKTTESPTETDLALQLKRRSRRDLRARATCLVAYETLATKLQDAFDLLRFSATQRGPVPTSVARLARDEHDSMAGEIVKAVRRTHAAAEADAVEADERRDLLLAAFSDLNSGKDLAAALIARHEKVQEGKGHEGKQPWFQRSERGVTVRASYAQPDEPEPRVEFLHPTRLANAQRFLAELS